MKKIITAFIFLILINQKVFAYEIFRDSGFNVYIIPESSEVIDFKIVRGERVSYVTDANNCNLIKADKKIAINKYGIAWGDYFFIYRYGDINPLSSLYQQSLPILFTKPCLNGQIQGNWYEFDNGIKGAQDWNTGMQYYQMPAPGKYDFSIEYESANSRKLTLNSCGFYRISATGKLNKDTKFMVNGTLYQSISALNEQRPYLCVRGIKYIPYNYN
ncbi:hypothetical protein H6G80_30630 [Nostoc sp. FACHB-87]|uniref:hypothetical protein n=1 Tax=Nostocaceae TaxID=1162 RepID=UPI001687D3ED|nr:MULTISPECIES: hypothetical protein [Nostocaceae]MBD2458410.1 hypothetical protein [Nostoc sp. FACHB-87]MBD2479494.1 hypothetical protein [Anabaena sp. FACHB-83]